MYWRFLIAWKFIRSGQKSKLINLITYLSTLTTICLVGLLILIFSSLRGFKEQFKLNALNHTGYYQIYPKNNHSLQKSEIQKTIELLYGSMLEIEEKHTVKIVNPCSKKAIFVIMQKNGLYTQGNKKDTITVNETFLKHFANSNSNEVTIEYYKNYKKNQLGIKTFLISQIVNQEPQYPIMYLSSEQFQYMTKGIILAFLKLIPNKNTKFSLQLLDSKEKQLKQSLPDYHIIHWKEINSSILQSMELENKITQIITMSLILLCIIINILSVTLFLFYKRNTIQILKTQKATALDITLIFSLYSGILAFFSIIVGIILGMVLCGYINELISVFGNITKMSLQTIFPLPIIPLISYKEVLLISIVNFMSIILSAIIMSSQFHSIEFH